MFSEEEASIEYLTPCRDTKSHLTLYPPFKGTDDAQVPTYKVRPFLKPRRRSSDSKNTLVRLGQVRGKKNTLYTFLHYSHFPLPSLTSVIPWSLYPYAMVTSEAKLSQNHSSLRRRPSEIIIFSARGKLPEIISKLSQRHYCSSRIFFNMYI